MPIEDLGALPDAELVRRLVARAAMLEDLAEHLEELAERMDARMLGPGESLRGQARRLRNDAEVMRRMRPRT
jgi:hypothetical protein